MNWGESAELPESCEPKGCVCPVAQGPASVRKGAIFRLCQSLEGRSAIRIRLGCAKAARAQRRWKAAREAMA